MNELPDLYPGFAERRFNTGSAEIFARIGADLSEDRPLTTTGTTEALDRFSRP